MNEDFAIEDFCHLLSVIEGREVSVVCRPDNKGQNGEGLPDFIISRGNVLYTVEHTFVESYHRQLHYNKLFNQSIRPDTVQAEVMKRFPGQFISIDIPIDSLRKKRESENFDSNLFLDELVQTISKTPEGRSINDKHSFQLARTRINVNISKCLWGTTGCFLTELVDIQSSYDWQEKILKIVEKKRPKLEKAKQHGSRTILLLQVDASILTNIFEVPQAFGDSAAKMNLTGIDEVFVLRGNYFVAPIKVDEAIYPALSQFEEYANQCFKLDEADY